MIVIEVEGSIDEESTQALRNAILAARILRRVYGKEAIALPSMDILNLSADMILDKYSDHIAIKINNKVIYTNKPPEPHKIVEWALNSEKIKEDLESNKPIFGIGRDRFVLGSIKIDTQI